MRWPWIACEPGGKRSARSLQARSGPKSLAAGQGRTSRAAWRRGARRAGGAGRAAPPRPAPQTRSKTFGSLEVEGGMGRVRRGLGVDLTRGLGLAAGCAGPQRVGALVGGRRHGLLCCRGLPRVAAGARALEGLEGLKVPRSPGRRRQPQAWRHAGAARASSATLSAALATGGSWLNCNAHTFDLVPRYTGSSESLGGVRRGSGLTRQRHMDRRVGQRWVARRVVAPQRLHHVARDGEVDDDQREGQQPVVWGVGRGFRGLG